MNEEEVEKSRITLKLDLNEELGAMIERGLNSKIVVAAVDLIMRELTPDRVRQLVESILMQAMTDFSRWEVERAIKARAGKVIETILERAEYQELIEKHVQDGVAAAIPGLPEMVKTELSGVIHEAMKNWGRRQQ